MTKLSLLSVASILALTACGTVTDVRQQNANHIARPAFMVDRTVPAGQFGLKAWERMHQRGAPATIYIEGDSLSDIEIDQLDKKGLLGLQSTPKNPVGLSLASRDKAVNLAYLARPCQYLKNPTAKGCSAKYWKENRFGPEVMEAYDTALNDIKARYDITEFHIVGYNGGANIAAVMAATRSDIKTLRTVAGDLNPKFNDAHNPAPVAPTAVLAIDYAAELSQIPQHHFIGAADEVVTPGIYHSYRQALGLSDCISYSLVQDADHVYGWTEKWPSLLNVVPKCAVVHELDGDLPLLKDFPGNFHKGKGFKK